MTANFTRLNPNDAKAIIEQDNSHILDIRDALSYQSGHINSAIHIDNQSIGPFIEQTDSESPIIVCCYHGNSSQNAAHYLSEQGFSNVYSLDGGYEQWKVMYPDACES